jgi:hypothetical protein
MALFGAGTYAQQSKVVKVTNNQQLLQAVENPSVNNLIFEGNYYESLSRYVGSGTTAKRGENGNRSSDCFYAIQPSSTCFIPDPDSTFVWNTAVATTFDPFTCLCCPPNDAGTWSIQGQPGGSTVQFMDALNEDTIPFRVNMPGSYLLRYSWGSPWNTHVQTEYFFYGPPDIELSAPDVCGLSTYVDFSITSAFFDSNRVVTWTLNGDPFAGPESDSLWLLEVDECGEYVLQVIATPSECPPDTATITINFFCEPVADAGPDVDVCYDMCYTLVGSTGLWPPHYNPDYYYFTWSQVSGPATLTFTPDNNETTYVCRPEGCTYGQYEVEFAVMNGLCTDADTMLLNFYEQPTADAGMDQSFCSEFCFTLDATPFPYCSGPIADERSGYWEFFDGPAAVTITDTADANTMVCILPADCPFGEYRFVWHEVNGTCWATDTVSVFQFEEPVAYAGPDSTSMCFESDCFIVYGRPYDYCTDTIGNRTHLYEVTGMPAGVTVTATEIAPYEFQICPSGECVFGEYEITLTETNQECVDVDVIHVYLFEPPTADAGEDFSMCYMGGCFSMGAMPFEYCSDPDENWGDRYGEWTKVSGPAMVDFDDANDPMAMACPDEEAACVYGVYSFEWTEYNGDCVDSDTVAVTLFEPPVAIAGDDAWYCVDSAFRMDLWHTFEATAYMYCQEEGLENYSFWSKCDGPGYVTWYDNEDNPNAFVNVSAFGCYCFVYHEVNGDCEATDTVHVCWYEHPYITGEDLSDSTCTDLCYDLGNLGIIPYEYLPAPNVNYNQNSWSMLSGAGVPTFTPDNTVADPEVCVDEYGCYVFQFIQYNGVEECADTVTADLWFFEQPVAIAGDDVTLCGNCYSMTAIPYSFVVNECAPAEDHMAYWEFYSYVPPDDFCDFYQYHFPCFDISDIYDPNAEICICEDEGYGYGMSSGTYGFIWYEFNGTCMDSDTVYITFNKVPDELPISGCVFDTYCSAYGGGPRSIDECGCATCWYPEDEVLTVCAGECGYFNIDWSCIEGGAIPGYTYEWSFTGPAGSFFEADPYWYDCTCNEWKGSDGINLCFGECCDTARLYLTITTPEGCETTEEWKFYVQHPPDATIGGPEIAEVSSVFEYSIPDPANPCYLYIWEVQHCGEIVYGQGTGTIGVHWTDYNQNGGWGLIYVEVYDTCTCCCNTDSLMVRVLPQYSLGDGTLEGYVYYNNAYNTPLNGVMLTLWNSGVPIFETYSFNDIDGGNGVGYYSFPGVNESTTFGLTAEYDAMWYGANATDALALELQVINPTWVNPVRIEAGDVNASGAMSATDALWIKQRAIAMVNHFPAGDWAFEPNMTSMAGSYNVMTLNYGDVHITNIPNSSKDMPAVAIVNDGVINVTPGEMFDLPIRVEDAVSLGAITLNLGYNASLLEVVEVNAVYGALTNTTSSNIAMAWSDVNPMVLNNNDAIVTLRLKALGTITSNDQLFSIGLGTEFADPTANVIEDVTLKAFGISTDPVATDYFLSYNRPNPFSTSTQIEYTLPESGKVRLSVVDLLGQEIAVLINQTQSAGSYTVQYNAAGVSTGVYIYKITVQGETRDFVETRRMVISK